MDGVIKNEEETEEEMLKGQSQSLKPETGSNSRLGSDADKFQNWFWLQQIIFSWLWLPWRMIRLRGSTLRLQVLSKNVQERSKSTKYENFSSKLAKKDWKFNHNWPRRTKRTQAKNYQKDKNQTHDQ